MSGNPNLFRDATTCTQCGKEISKEEKAKHFHVVNRVSDDGDPLVYALLLPPDCKPEDWKARNVFADGIAELKKMYPGKTFQITAYSYKVVSERGPDSSNIQLQYPESLLAIEN